jgi:predicted phage terminase large subunit-like protein
LINFDYAALSLAEQVALLPEAEAARILADLDQDQLFWDWSFWGRPAQMEPRHNPRADDGLWNTWMALAGRGFGKTRAGAEWSRKVMTGRTPLSRGRFSRMAIVCETAADARDVMVEGPSGILYAHPPGFRPDYEPSKRRLTWPNGAQAFLYNAVEPDQLRGPQHDCALCDELAKWRYVQETYDQLQFGLRMGDHPQQVIMTTPRPIPIIRDLLKDPYTVVTRGSTYENLSNLAPSFLKKIIARYEGTRLGRQELQAEVLDDIAGALWTRDMIDRLRLRKDVQTGEVKLPRMVRVVIGVDPSGTKGDSDGENNLVGIVAAGKGADGHGYVLDDVSCDLSPEGWARQAINAYRTHQADRIVAEVNYGGAMVQAVIRSVDRNVSYKAVTASRGKVIRAEPVAALYEQGKVHHVGSFPEMEDQLVAFTPNGYMGEGSPDRADALVWALTEVMLGGPGYQIAL